jgi:tetratricopeptide (TPR) repeat protein
MVEARPVDYSRWDDMRDSNDERSEPRRHAARERVGTAGKARLGRPALEHEIPAEADFLEIYSKMASGDGAPTSTHAFPATLMKQRARCEEARALKEEGNAAFRQGDLERAARLYERGVFKFADWYGDEYATEEEKALVHESKLPLHLNLAACSSRLGNHAHAAAHASQVLQHQPRHAKALYRRGASLTALGDLDGARPDLELAAELAPDDAGVRRALRECRAAQQSQRERERRLVRRMTAWGAGEAAAW